MEDMRGQKRTLRPVRVHKRTVAENERVLEDQRAIARMLSTSPREMMSASNAFLCGWLARDSMTPSKPGFVEG